MPLTLWLLLNLIYWLVAYYFGGRKLKDLSVDQWFFHLTLFLPTLMLQCFLENHKSGKKESEDVRTPTERSGEDRGGSD